MQYTTDDPLIFFDFDGTLVDSLKTIQNTVQSVEPSFNDDALSEIQNGNTEHFIASFNAKHQVNLLKEYGKVASRQQLFPGVKKILKTLAEKHRLFIVSAGSTQGIKECLTINHSEQFITKIIGGDIQSNKAIAMQSILKEYQGMPQMSILISDTTSDIASAKELGILSIGVTWGSHNQERLKTAEPDKIIDQVQQLSLCIKQLLPTQTSL